jgi:hypothetical protein
VPAHLEGLPESIGAGETIGFALVVHTGGRWGKQTFEAAISTDSPNTPKLSIIAELEIHADEIRQRRYLGQLRAGCCDVVRVFRLYDVPAEKLIGVGEISDPSWSVTCHKVNDGVVDVELRGCTPSLPADLKDREFSLAFTLSFQKAPLGRVKVTVAASLMPEWSFPEIVYVNPLSSPDGQATVVVIHRPADEARDESTVVPLTGSSGVQARVITKETDGASGWMERRHKLTFPVPPDLGAQGSIQLQLTGDTEVSVVSIPIVNLASSRF